MNNATAVLRFRVYRERYFRFECHLVLIFGDVELQKIVRF